MDPPEPPSHRWEIDGPSPPFPYIPGFSIKIRPYTSPTTSQTQTQMDAEKSLKARHPPGTHKISPIEYCIANPYCQLETKQAAETSSLAEEHVLHVDSIVTHPARDVWWNVAQCHLNDDTKSKCTAKIHDPVYAGHVMWAHMGSSGNFNREVQAYTRIKDKGIEGEVTPVFLGAWTMDVPVPSKDFGGVDYATTRPVPLLLFQEVEAANLATTYLRYYYTSDCITGQPQLPQAWRLEVLAKMYEAHALLSHAGVYTKGSMEGVSVGTSTLEDGRLDVKVYLEGAGISDLEERTGETLELPVSPIETYWNEVLYDGLWLVEDEWGQPEDEKYHRQWLVQRWGDSTKYRPLPEVLRHRIADGKWKETSRPS